MARKTKRLETDAPAESPKKKAHTLLDFLMEQASWVPALLIGLLNLAGAIFLAFLGDLETTSEKVRLGIAIVLLLLGVAVTVGAERWRYALNKAQQTEVAQFTVAVTDVLTPLSDRIGRMIETPSAMRTTTLAGIRSDVANAVVHLFPEVDRIRAVVYHATEDDRQMEPVQRAGRKDTPRPFVLGDKGRGDRAFHVLRTGEPIFETNYVNEQRSYKTYMNIRIAAGDQGFGVLTVDAPRAEAFLKSDLDLVSLLASQLAVATAEALRR